MPEELNANQYDSLFQLGPELEAPQIDLLPKLTDRQRLIFKPVVRPDTAPKPTSYDWLLNSSLAQPETSVEAAAIRKKTDRSPDPESENDAIALLESHATDPIVEKIISLYATHTLSPIDKVHLLQANPLAREHLAAYFLDKINKIPARMPARVLSNTEKSTNFPGYEYRMASRDYAALLAISMLDGSFKKELESADPVEVNAERGQHRTAARQLLLPV